MKRSCKLGFAVLIVSLVISGCDVHGASVTPSNSLTGGPLHPSTISGSPLGPAPAGQLTAGALVGGSSSQPSSTATSTSSTDVLDRPGTVQSVGAVRCSGGAQKNAGVVATTGTVYYDENQNGKRDSGEPGLAGVPVYMANGPDAETPAGEKAPATCTNQSGAFSLTPPDTHTRYQVWFRTGWFRTQCPALTCAIGSAGDNVQTGPEWIYSRNFVTGKTPGTYLVGLIPDAGQYVKSIRSKTYLDYPPDLSQAHVVDLTARFTDDESPGCKTTKNGVNCKLGGAIAQTLYIGNSGLTAASGVKAVMQLPFGETHRQLTLLSSGSSPEVTSLSDVKVVPALFANTPGRPPTTANYTTITFTLKGTIPPAGFVSILSNGILAQGIPGTQIVGRAGITAEDHAEADKDSGFCPTPAVPTGGCLWVSDTHSFLDVHGDDTDSNRFNIVK